MDTLKPIFTHGSDALLFGMLDAEGQERLAAAVAENDPDTFEQYPEVRTPRNTVGKQNRCVRFLCDPKITHGYFFAKTVARSHAPGPQSLALLAYVNEKFGARYNAILVNHYKSGADYISDHSDDERGLDASVGVLVLSAGATRTMAIKRAQKAPPGVPELGKGGFKVEVCNNSVLVMHGETFQTKFSHGMPQRANVTEPRTSFTFRYHTNKHDAQGIREANATAAFIARKKREREA